MDIKSFSSVTFKLQTQTTVGSLVGIVGDCSQLGNWNLQKALYLISDENSYPVWRLAEPVILPLHKRIEYKYFYVCNGEVVWESFKANRRICLKDKNVEVIDYENSPVQNLIVLQETKLPPGAETANQFQYKTPIPFGPQDSVILVSWKLPIRIEKSKQWSEDQPTNQKWSIQQSSGMWVPLLYQQLLNMKAKFTWIGISMYSTEDQSEIEELTKLLYENYNCLPIFLDQELLDEASYYCREVLFPIFHNVIDISPEYSPQYSRRNWECFKRVNNIFAQTILNYHQDELIWLHDYQLLLTPSMIQSKTDKTINIGLYFHSPFPSSEVYRVLAHREQILNAILTCDLIGFHLFEYARHFITSCKRLLGIDHLVTRGGDLALSYLGRQIMIRVSHVGVEPTIIQSILNTDQCQNITDQLREEYQGKIVFLGIDYMHRLSGIGIKLQAFKQFLQNFQPRDNITVENIVLIQIIQPAKIHSRADIEICQKEVKSLQTEINQKFKCQQVIIIEKDVLPQERLAYFSIANAVIITSLRDGLNLVPFELLAAVGSKKVTIILSEFAGVSRALNSPVRVNPYSLDSVEAAMVSAIFDHEQSNIKLQQDIAFINKQTTRAWCENFLADLKRAYKDISELQYLTEGEGDNVRLMALKKNLRPLQYQEVVEKYQKSQSRLFLFDNEGTLTSIQKTGLPYQETQPNEQIIQFLKDLCSDNKNLVFIITGRTKQDLTKWFKGIPNLNLMAEYGSFIRWKNSFEWTNQLSDSSLEWKPIATEIIKSYVAKTEGSILLEKETIVCFLYRNADPDYGEWQAKELRVHLEMVLSPFGDQCKISSGLSYVEVKPQGIDKGNSTLRVIEEISYQKGPIDFILAAGDDIADEKMFNVVNNLENSANAFTIIIGKKSTCANYYVNSIFEFEQFLKEIQKSDQRIKRTQSDEAIKPTTPPSYRSSLQIRTDFISSIEDLRSPSQIFKPPKN